VKTASLTALCLSIAISACEQIPVTPRSGVATLDDAGSDNFVAVSAGREHTCALVTDGTPYCWGSNEFGQLGVPMDTASSCLREDRSIACKRQPVVVAGGLKFQKIRAGRVHTCGLGFDNHIYCWGDNLDGQLGDPSIRRSFTPIAALSNDSFTDLAAGGKHTCALRTDGVLFCWGANGDGQLGLATVGNGSAIPVATQTSQRFSSVAAGDRRTCARVPEGTTYCAGATWVFRQNTLEVTRPQGSLSRVLQSPAFQALAVGTNTTCGVSTENVAYCWEANPAGGIGDGTTSGSTLPKPVSMGPRFVAISAGGLHTCAIADTGLAYCWGADGLGQLGVSPGGLNSRCGEPAAACSKVPVRVSGWRVFNQISAGQGDHACGLTLGGNIYCWGAGGLGQRGDGRTSNEWSPTKTRSP
jgi:alpha-tubulin suppressor-like RCC1 family protein